MVLSNCIIDHARKHIRYLRPHLRCQLASLYIRFGSTLEPIPLRYGWWIGYCRSRRLFCIIVISIFELRTISCEIELLFRNTYKCFYGNVKVFKITTLTNNVQLSSLENIWGAYHTHKRWKSSYELLSCLSNYIKISSWAQQ